MGTLHRRAEREIPNVQIAVAEFELSLTEKAGLPFRNHRKIPVRCRRPGEWLLGRWQRPIQGEGRISLTWTNRGNQLGSRPQSMPTCRSSSKSEQPKRVDCGIPAEFESVIQSLKEQRNEVRQATTRQ